MARNLPYWLTMMLELVERPLEPRQGPAGRARRVLLISMVIAVLAIGGVAWWDSSRESTAALEDFEQEQSALVTSVAAELGTRLALARRDTGLAVSPQQLFAGLAVAARPGELQILGRSPGTADFMDARGRPIAATALARDLAAGQRVIRVEREEAATLGLPRRLAIAALAAVDAGTLGRWEVVVVASAVRVRDRERRATARLLLSIALATGLVGAFGGLLLRTQRRELRLERDLALAELARQRDERLERLDKAATMLTLASGMAHELGTPLGVIVGRAEQLLGRANGDERGVRAAQAILDEAQHINEVVRGFLSLARGSAPALQQLPPEMVAASAGALVEHRFEKAGLRLAINVADDLPQVLCEPRLLQHALVNLLLNACDACSHGGRVELRAARDEQGVRFTVLDDGSGIARADAARIAEPFFTTKPPGQGTGLGLAIVNEIAKTHHGSLAISPAEPRGTRACLTIPASLEVALG
jgi:signal transduction histidine kinase